MLLETSHNPFLVQVSSAAARPSIESAGWERIDRFRESMRIDFRKAQSDQHQEIAARCARLLTQ